jgi:penicillin-binding protein 2
MADYFNNRQNITKVIFIAIAAVLIIRLFVIQVVSDYGAVAQGQSISRQVIYPARGSLLDRNGKSILQNTLNYNLFFTPKLLGKSMDTLSLCKILGITDSAFKETMRRASLREQNKNKPVVAFKDLSAERIAGLQEIIGEYPGFELREHTVRSSPYACGGLVVGYTAEINSKMIEDTKYAAYSRGDYIGMAGLESFYEDILVGQRGVKYSKRDNLNRLQGSYKNGKLDSIAKKGADLSLYMDIELQQYAEKLLSKKIGSLVAIDPKTGGILAMASAPTFDPNIVNSPDRSKIMSAMLVDAAKPLYNRAVLAQYPPGSTFKPLSALVALDEQLITPSFGYACGGRYHSCGGKIKCTHSGGGHAANLRNAMANSCNSYFCHLFRLAVDNPKYGDKNKGITKWNEYMHNFGLGQKTDVDLPNEKPGSIPDAALYNKVYNNNWNSCMNCMVGMGQGELLLTPIQMANAMCLIANKGYYYTPHFVRAIGGDSNHVKIRKYLKKHVPVHIADSSFEAVLDGMEAVVSQGTGTVAKIPGIRVCGKTGTVENYAIINGKHMKLKNHSMFVAFAPRENPRIAIAVCVENSGYGATWAGPIAALIMQKYLTDTIPRNRKALEQKMFKANIIPNIIYQIDSVQKQNQRLKEARKKFIIDSTNQFIKIRDSIFKSRNIPIPLKEKSKPKPSAIKGDEH